QTLGMQAWKIKLISDEKLTPRVCLLRCAFSTFSFLLFGLGYFLIFFRKDKKSLADLATKTRIIRIK
ncbi:MAG: RDD family protein, partial [Pseudomonadota bacterium]|nr:RDD family protein [Pseudomonadota bacterium]